MSIVATTPGGVTLASTWVRIPGTALATLTGSETVTGLAVGQATEIHVSHDPLLLAEYPYIAAPTGVRVTVLACGTAGTVTNGSGFVLLIENVSYTGGSGSPPDITLNWSRTGRTA